MTEPTTDGPTTTFLDSLGARGLRRAEPRASIAVAGAGCALAILGVLIVAGDTGSSGDDFNKAPGILLSALVVAAGFLTLNMVRVGALATAGTVAAALGVPPLMFFLTFDEGGFPPYSTDGILVVSTLIWLGAYVIGPSRGRPFFLGAGLIGAWLTVLQLTEDVFDFPFGLLGGFAQSFEPAFEDDFGSGSFGPTFDTPDPTTMGLLSLGFGALYLVMARRLDTTHHHGVATPFALATLPSLLVGTVLLGDELEQAGTGLLLILVGAALTHHGSTLGRRATAWVGAAATAIGAAVFLSDMTDDATIAGMLFLAGGIGLVAAGHAVATARREPDEMEIALGDPNRPGWGAPLVTSPYAPGWTPPPDAEEPVPPGHWNPPPSGSPAPTPPPPPPPPPPGADDEAAEQEADASEWRPPADPEDPTSPPS